MSDKDIEEYHNIGKPIPRSEKYIYINGKQITDHETGTRVYEVNNDRLPSVTKILGATKDQTFLKNKKTISEKSKYFKQIKILWIKTY